MIGSMTSKYGYEIAILALGITDAYDFKEHINSMRYIINLDKYSYTAFTIGDGEHHVHRKFWIHLCNMLHIECMLMKLVVYNWLFKRIQYIVYRIQSIKHIFSYNKQNKVGQMNLLILKYS